MNRNIRAATLPVVALTLAWSTHAAAQAQWPSAPSAAPGTPPTVEPAPPSIVWRIAGREHDRNHVAQYRSSFSPDGRSIGIVNPSRTVRLVNASDGSLIDRVPPESAQRLSYSMAIANTGRVAVGRQGSMEVYDVSRGGPVPVFPCTDEACQPISLAFSPDGSLLAFDEVPMFPERRLSLGAVRVVDLEFDDPTHMKASTGLARVSFSSGDGPAVSRPASSESASGIGFRIWHTSDWQLPQTMLGRGWTVGSVPADSAEEPTTLVAVYATGTQIVMREFSNDRLLWAAPLIPPEFASGPARQSDLDRVELAPNGRFLIGYESPVASNPEESAAGAIVVRRAIDGAIVEVYDVPGVSDLAIAPDSKTFVYSTGMGRTHTALVRVPAL